MKMGMETHMYILIQMMIYAYKQEGFPATANSIREDNDIGKAAIRLNINKYLK